MRIVCRQVDLVDPDQCVLASYALCSNNGRVRPTISARSLLLAMGELNILDEAVGVIKDDAETHQAASTNSEDAAMHLLWIARARRKLRWPSSDVTRST